MTESEQYRDHSKNRKKRGQRNISKRKMCFVLFQAGYGAEDAAVVLNITLNEARVYRWQWSRMPRQYLGAYEQVRFLYNQLSHRQRKLLSKALAIELNTTGKAMSETMQQPWFWHQLLTGKSEKWQLPTRPRGVIPWITKHIVMARLLLPPSDIKYIVAMVREVRNEPR